MLKKVAAIKTFTVGSASFNVDTQDLKALPDRVMKARNSPKWKNAAYRMNISMNIQIMEWAYDICKIQKQDNITLNEFLKNTYYMAQKKGRVPGKFGTQGERVRFGPFIKLS